ncbi:hypothetical protein C5O26_00590 [Bacillus velezensis]|nr:hypothetical protein C5O26_00590 [Bacillus velezensis]
MAETKKYVRIKKARSLRNWYSVRIGKVYIVIGENEIEYITHVGVVLKEDAEFIFTENRKAAVGERVLITKTVSASGTYNVGDIFTVQTADEYGGIFVKERLAFLIRPEYEVIIENMGDDEMKIDLNAMGYDELLAHGDAVMEAIKKRTFQEGFRAAKQVQRKLAKMNAEKSAQVRRDKIVEQAKADVDLCEKSGTPIPSDILKFWPRDNGKERYLPIHEVEYVVNYDKRAVVVLIKRIGGEVVAKGIAKAAPDDCFNVHIGKAIALRRALGLAVPDEYLNAPQPTEVRVGDVISDDSGVNKALVIEDDSWPPFSSGSVIYLKDARKYGYRIIDDSREEVGE